MTHKFKLVSGVLAEVRELTGKHQRLMTAQGVNHQETINSILKDVIVSVGDQQVMTDEFMRTMLSEDRRLCLLMSRQLSMDFPEIYEFDYEYVSVKTNKKERVSLEIPTTFAVTPMPEQATNYSDIRFERFIVLPKSGLEVRWNLLTSVGEESARHFPLSSHTSIQMRMPAYKDKGTWISLDLDKLPLKDIETLRKEIKAVEGSVDTLVTFPHPEADLLPVAKQTVTVDILSTVSFFFPSGAI